MKKFFVILISLVLLLSIMPAEAFAVSRPDLDYLVSYFKNNNINVDYILDNETDVFKPGESVCIGVAVYNRNETSLHNATLSLELPAGISIAHGTDKVVVGSVTRGKVAYAEFPLIIENSIVGQSAKITATVSGYYWADYGDEYSVEQEKSFSEAFYVPIVGEGHQGPFEGKPVLLLSNYSCGGSVKAGSNFGLTLSFLNTSTIDLHNIKITVNGGTSFLPVGSSNSFYVESIAAGETYSKTLTMSCPKDTPQGPASLTITSAFNEGESSDVISVPVVQETRLVIDDILDPGWLVMGEQGYCNVSYRNMGNNQVNNLTITAEGDFDMDVSPLKYVGNVASGRQESYSFNFWPRQEGPCSGTVNFTYEDADGKEHTITKEFTFNIGPAYNWDEPVDPDAPIEEPGFHMPVWGWIACAVGAIVILLVVLKIIKKRKQKKQEALDLDV